MTMAAVLWFSLVAGFVAGTREAPLPLSWSPLVPLASALGPQDSPRSSVGVPVRIDQVVIEGPLVQVKAAGFESPLSLRIVDVWPHGAARRYDFEVYGLEPGRYDLAEYLQYEDGTEVGSVDGLQFDVDSVLPPGQVEPRRLESQTAPGIGGFQRRLIFGGVLWGLIGLALFFVGRRKRREEASVSEGKPQSLAQRLRPMVERAVAGKLDVREQSELELTLLAYWRRRLDREDCEPAELLAQLKQHDEAGPLFRGLEDWLHRPTPPADVDLAALLRPYENIEDPDDTATAVNA